MSHFKRALADVRGHEGGKVNHSADKGGATAYGISLRFLQSLPVEAGDIDGDGHVSIADVQALTPAQADGFYKAHFWDHYRLGEIAHCGVATKLFNCFVNMRGKTAALIAQRAANDLGARLVEDGVAGSKTFAALNDCSPLALLVCIKWRMWEVYRAIIAHDPAQAVFRNGWRKRAFSRV